MQELFSNRKKRDFLIQTLAISLVAFVLISMVLQINEATQRQGMVSGFDFLRRSTSWDVSFSLLSFSISDSYAKILWIGFLNTLFAGLIGLSGATVFGFLVGLARLSPNFLLRSIGTVYVEFFRNIPLILQVIFWYAVLTRLPHPREAISIGNAVFFTNRGIYGPWLNAAPWVSWAIIGTFALCGVASFLVTRARRASSVRSRLPLLFVIASFVLSCIYIALGHYPEESLLTLPVMTKLNIRGGLLLPPELAALVFGIWIYGGAYIGEIIRGGFMAVKKGQVEAARSLGLHPFQIFTRIQFPLAIRAILPTLANQYVWLMKATTLGIAIGFADFFLVISTSINQSGQTLELLGILMIGFLIINLSIAAIMNWFNRKLALKGNNARS